MTTIVGTLNKSGIGNAIAADSAATYSTSATNKETDERWGTEGTMAKYAQIKRRNDSVPLMILLRYCLGNGGMLMVQRA